MEANELCYVDATGFHRSTYEDVLAYINGIYYTTFGNDINIDPDSQDGELIAAANARPLFDTILIAEAVYNSFSPAVAMGDALRRNVRINGIEAREASYSTVELDIEGAVGTTIVNGVAEDVLSQKWSLPASVIIPLAGEITVTATAQLPGSITTAANTITKIATPTRGWLSVNNSAVPTAGRAAESDAELRARQQISVAIAARSVAESIEGNVASQDGVSREKFYENDEPDTDDDGIPANSIAVVVEGGDDADIAEAIATTKCPGTGTYGTTTVTVYDEMGMPNDINFFRPTIVDVAVEVTLEVFAGFVDTTEDLIKIAVVNYINGLDIGDDVITTKLYVPCNLDNIPVSSTYQVNLIRTSADGGAFGTSNIVIDFNEAAQAAISEVEIIYV